MNTRMKTHNVTVMGYGNPPSGTFYPPGGHPEVTREHDLVRCDCGWVGGYACGEHEINGLIQGHLVDRDVFAGSWHVSYGPPA